MSEEVSKTEMTVEIVANYVANNEVPVDQLADLIRTVSNALEALDKPEPVESHSAPKPTPAQIKKSIKPDALISFVDGKPYKTLKRHLAKHGLTVAAYREKYGLPNDYPTTAPEYSAQRSEMAKSLGLGSSARRVDAAPTARRRGRPKKVAVE